VKKIGLITIGIDASRNRSGGAVAHLKGILTEGDPASFGIIKVHVWAYKTLLDAIPDRPWLIKHNPPALEKSIVKQLWWQRFGFPAEVKKTACQIVLNTDAGTISTVRPAVTMSQDMLSYEPGAIERYGFSLARLRLILLRFIQSRSLREADGSIFLTHYAAKVIQQSCGALPSIAIIPHGIGSVFKHTEQLNTWPKTGERSIRCVYVSNTAMYKHQWLVVRAIVALRKRGHDLTLTLIGGGKGQAQQLLQDEIVESDPEGVIIRQLDFVPQIELPTHLANADLFVFASSCENMPNTLLEAMAVGLPIACSNRGPMPQVLEDGGVYFDPEDTDSIADAIAQIIQNPTLRSTIAQRAKTLSEQYSWARCADETWAFVTQTWRMNKDRYTKHRPYQICTNCVMDTTDSKISFDEKGVCDHCNSFFHHTLPNWHTDERGASELSALVERIKHDGKGKDFDCIIGMSGGIDSSYLTYLAKEKFGLRPLLFHVDAGWNSEVAVNNIEKLVDGLGIDLYTEVIDWEEMRDLQLAFFKSGVPHIDSPQDNAFFAMMYKFARQYKVKYILTGANLSTECIRNPVEWMYYQSDSWQLKDIHRQFGKKPLINYPLTSILWHKIYLPYVTGIKTVRPLNYVPYIKRDAMHLLIDRFGWQPYPQKHFESRFTRFYESYWLPKRFGYDVRRVQYSSLILTGQLSRQEALEKLKQSSYDESTIAYDLEYVANKLRISVTELNSYLDMPKRTFRDYKSQRQIYDWGAKAMKALGLEVGGKR
jgi:N-acetyl sugar amidotransferase